MLVPVSVVAGAIPAAAQFSGAIQTTLPNGTTVNGNLYPSKGRVFISGGPQNSKANGLPDGKYYFQVTDPGGAMLLSNDPAMCRQVVVSSGKIAGAYDPVTQTLEPAGTPLDGTHCEHASNSANPSNGSVPVQVGGAFRACPTGTSPDMFCDTPNPGAEYKLWLIAQSSAVSSCNPTVNADGISLTFDSKCAKSDNFKLVLPASANVVACKFNDTNNSGTLDKGELMISGWPITATVPASSYVTLRSGTQAGTSVTANTGSAGCVSFSATGIPNSTQVTVTLTEASEIRWTQTAPANGTYDGSGNTATTGPTSVAGGILSVNLGPGDTVTAPQFGNYDVQCPDCSILGTVTVIKTATPNKLYTWGITKSVDKTEVDNVPPTGGSATFNYTVSVTHDGGTGSLLTGTITVINGDGSNPSTTLNVSDAVSNGGVCTIQDPTSKNYVPQVFNLTLNSFTETSLPYQCTYSSAPSPSTGTNTATATNASNSSLQYTGTAKFDFSNAAAIADGSVTISDTLGGQLGTVSYTDASPKTITYQKTFTGDNPGACTSHPNTATLTTSTTGTTASASQSVKVCVNPPPIVTLPSPTSVTLGSFSVKLSDTATLSGLTNPQGTITFTLVAPGGATVDTETVTVNGNGNYTTPTGYTLSTNGTLTGTYQWNATYTDNNNSNNNASEINNTGEQVVVLRVSPVIIVTQATVNGYPTGTTTVGATLGDAAVLVGGVNPTGTVTFTLMAPNGTNIYTETVTVNGNGTYTTGGTGTGSRVATMTGTYVWSATYSGDSNNNSAHDNGFNESVTVSATTP